MVVSRVLQGCFESDCEAAATRLEGRLALGGTRAPLISVRTALDGDRQFASDGERFALDDVDDSRELAHYFTRFPSGRDFGLADVDGDTVRAVAWLVFLPAEDPGFGFVDDDIPELSITTFEGHRGEGIGSALLTELIDRARSRGIRGMSLSVADGNGARRLYERTGFQIVGWNAVRTPCFSH